MTQLDTPVCYRCSRFKGKVTPGKMFCEAFPKGKGIPRIVIDEGNKHTAELPGDHGLRFQPKEGGDS